METQETFSEELEKILEYIISKDYDNEIDILSNLVKEIVKREEFSIIGGRVWEIEPKLNSYRLKFQIGDMKEIPIGITQSLSNDHFYSEMLKLKKDKVLLGEESHEELKKAGIGNYAGAGVGELIHLESGKFFKYLLGFNAEKYNEEFFDVLRLISRLATIAVRNYDKSKAAKRLNKDLNKAADIQRNLLPEHYVEFEDYRIFGVCVPDKEIGGDYFDYMKNNSEDDEESLGVLICDCASKGLPAAIQALFVSGALRMGMNFSPKISNIFGRLNNLLNRTFSKEQFVTLFYGELTLSSNRLILYANAGHCPPIHYRPSKDKFQFLPATGGFLGIMPHQKYKLENCRMLQGDTLLLYTDGITEAMNEKGDLFGEDKVKEILKKNIELPAKEIAYKILEEVQRFSSKSIYNDDKTLVVIKRESK